MLFKNSPLKTFKKNSLKNAHLKTLSQTFIKVASMWILV